MREVDDDDAQQSVFEHRATVHDVSLSVRLSVCLSVRLSVCLLSAPHANEQRATVIYPQTDPAPGKQICIFISYPKLLQSKDADVLKYYYFF